MRFQVPQFIEVENKVFGPLTVEQFIYLAGGGGLAYLFYAFFPFLLVIIIDPIIVGFALALAFYKVNNRPFIYTVESATKYYLGNKLYIWKKATNKPNTAKMPTPAEEATQKITLGTPKLSESKLKDLAWSLDIKKGSGR